MTLKTVTRKRNKNSVRFESGTKNSDHQTSSHKKQRIEEFDKEEEKIEIKINQNVRIPKSRTKSKSLNKEKPEQKQKPKKAAQSKSKIQPLEVKAYSACSERKWDDNKKRRMTHGKFTPRELILLQKAICEYAKANRLDENDLEDLRLNLKEHKIKI